MSIIVHRVSPQVARYTPAGGRERCGACRFYISPRFCGKVIGPVSPMGWCKYFSRQMVSQFGGSQAVAIGPPGASLDLGFMAPGVLDPRITFSRASTATYTDASGTIRSAAVNAPRWDYSGGSLRGLLIEEARTNLVLNSGDVSNASWQKSANPNAPPGVLANQTTAPDGTLTAALVNYLAVSGAADFANVFVSPIVTANPYSFSVYMKGSVGGEQLYIMTTPDGVLYYRTLCTLTTAWQRFVLTTPALTAATWYFQIGVDRRDASQTAKPVQTVFMWGGQIEQGAFPTSYIPTTGAAVTRAFDSCFIAPANMSPWFASPGGSWFVEFINNVPTPATFTSPRVIGIHDGTSITPIWVPSTPNLSTYDGSQVFTLNTVVTGAVSKGVSTWASGTGKICLNGQSVASGSMVSGFATLATAGIGILGGNPGVVNESMTGTIRRVQYWPRVLSDAEMQQVTA